ncbi:MAG: signal peptidase I [Gemmatimonadaceae bacterium]|nr:signal peptidase I [Gemmatimonadaceae bacterium]
MAADKKSTTTPAPVPNVVAAARGKTAAPAASSRLDGLKGWIVPILIFFVIRIFFFQAYRIPSPSMQPEMMVGDWLFVNNLVYGPNIPFTDVTLPGYAEPKRREIVVFKSPYQADEAQLGNDPQPTLVKRMWGQPGDTLYMRDGVIHVNGTAYPQRADESTLKIAADETHPLFAWQHSIEVKNSRFGEPPVVPTHDNWGPLAIPAGHLFMLGDNRYESKDSRYWGIVPRGNLRGRPIFVYYSYNANDSDRALPFITDIRWSRIGHIFR